MGGATRGYTQGMYWLLAGVSVAADFDQLLSPSGWTSVGEVQHELLGTVSIALKTVEGERCLRGRAISPPSPEILYDVVTDIPAAKRFSREKLLASEVLDTEGDTVHYYQHLDVPGWTLAADRYWVLEGRSASSGSARAFRWRRFDWRPRYPELAARIQRDHPNAVEPDPNWGSWVFEPTEGGTQMRYYICSDPGGSIPGWVERTAATRSLPNTMADVAREAIRRTGP
ncbi:MAG TPA: hypothetical protein ENK18_01195 [Deltaproteobacteria bacterium]|nr:hypothetical protein [Deltaproteobacteria bacterium]